MKYTCPMHPEVQSDEETGRCPKCGMNLVPEGTGGTELGQPQYGRLVTVIGLITVTTLALGLKDLQAGTFAWENTVTDFMAGFFLVFAGFKLLDLRAFAQSYSMYDLLAKKVFQYGYAYPIIELAFGLAFLTSFYPGVTAVAEVLVMGFSGAGVALSLAKKRGIQCACLGTVIRVPLGTVTLVEDFGMAALGLALLALVRIA